MQFINFMDNIFSNHPVLSIAFSGFGIAIVSAIIYIIRKIMTSHKHYYSQIFSPESETTIPISPQTELTINFPQIDSDIETIERSIKFDSNYNKKIIFLRYFNKYKNNFCQDDVETLSQQSSSSYPDYPSLLSQLLGLIEALNNN